MNIHLDIPVGAYRHFTEKELIKINRSIKHSHKTH